MADPFDSPVDSAASTDGVPAAAYMAMVVAATVVTLAVLNMQALAAWADGLNPSARTATVAAAAHALADQTATRGLDAPRAAVKSAWDRAKAAKWPGEAAAGTGAQR